MNPLKFAEINHNVTNPKWSFPKNNKLPDYRLRSPGPGAYEFKTHLQGKEVYSIRSKTGKFFTEVQVLSPGPGR